jgi:hypothetical protein
MTGHPSNGDPSPKCVDSGIVAWTGCRRGGGLPAISGLLVDGDDGSWCPDSVDGVLGWRPVADDQEEGPPSAGDGSQLIPGPGSSLAKTLQAIDTDARGSSVISKSDEDLAFPMEAGVSGTGRCLHLMMELSSQFDRSRPNRSASSRDPRSRRRGRCRQSVHVRDSALHLRRGRLLVRPTSPTHRRSRPQCGVLPWAGEPFTYTALREVTAGSIGSPRTAARRVAGDAEPSSH